MTGYVNSTFSSRIIELCLLNSRLPFLFRAFLTLLLSFSCYFLIFFVIPTTLGTSLDLLPPSLHAHDRLYIHTHTSKRTLTGRGRWYLFDSVGLSPDFVRDAAAKYKRKAR